MKNRSWLRISGPLVFLFTLGFLMSLYSEWGIFPGYLGKGAVVREFQRLSNWVTDRKFQVRGSERPRNKIVIASIDVESIERFGRWPWHRDMFAKIIESLLDQGALVVGVDIFMPERDVRIPLGLQLALKKRSLDTLTGEFDSDPKLIDLMKRRGDQVVLGLVTESTCQPSVDDPGKCTVSLAKGLEGYTIPNVNRSSSFSLIESPLYVSRSILRNFTELQEVTKFAGLVDGKQDSDGVTRRVVLLKFPSAKSNPIPSLALEVARVAVQESLSLELGSNQKITSFEFSKSHRNVPSNPLGELEINFRGLSDSFPRLSIVDLLGPDDRVNVSVNLKTGMPFDCKTCRVAARTLGRPQMMMGVNRSELLKDAIVFLGVTSPLYDTKPIPLDYSAPGVISHAMVVDNILSGDALVSGGSNRGWVVCLLLLVFGALGFAFAIDRLGSTHAVLITLGAFAGLFYLDFKILFSRNINWNTGPIYLEYFAIATLALINKYGLEEKRRKFLKEAFSRYVSPHVVKTIISDPTKLALGGVKKPLTVLFSDIRGFMPLAERLPAQELQSFLRDYHNIITRYVIEYGTLDKYIGDAVMAFWGAPLDQPKHAANACRAAVQIVRAVREANPEFQKKYGTPISIGIGINSGPITVGNMGSELLFSYTVVGDDVNLAARVERLTRYYGVNILTTRNTFKSIESSGEPVPPHRILDLVKVIGSNLYLEVIQVLEDPIPEAALAAYDQGRIHYNERRWDEAMDAFRQAKTLIRGALQQEDRACNVMIDRCDTFKVRPPGENWDGAWEMGTK